MTKKRKSPIRHKVRSHTREGHPVRSFIRGKGNKTPIGQRKRVITTSKLTLIERKRLLKKLSIPEWTGHYANDISWDDIPSGVQNLLLAEKRREQKIIQKYKNDPARMQVELIYDHAKRLVDSGKLSDRTDEVMVAWNTAVQNCKYQYKGTLPPFSREVDLTEKYYDKLKDYYEKINKERFPTLRHKQVMKIVNKMNKNEEKRDKLREKINLTESEKKRKQLWKEMDKLNKEYKELDRKFQELG